MGQFNAGAWIIALALYFTLYFLIVYTVISASATYTDMQTTGIVPPSGWTPTGASNAGGYCQNSAFSYLFCVDVGTAHGEDGCNLTAVCGCNWVSGIFSDSCSGDYLPTLCRYDDTKVIYNQSLCQTLNYDWIYATNDSSHQQTSVKSSEYDWSATYQTFASMFGFSGGSLGFPTNVWTPFLYLIFTWIPLAMLIWAIYMALPFAH